MFGFCWVFVFNSVACICVLPGYYCCNWLVYLVVVGTAYITLRLGIALLECLFGGCDDFVIVWLLWFAGVVYLLLC